MEGQSYVFKIVSMQDMRYTASDIPFTRLLFDSNFVNITDILEAGKASGSTVYDALGRWGCQAVPAGRNWSGKAQLWLVLQNKV